MAGYAGNTFIMDVVRAGVPVFVYWKANLHAKTISIDSEVCSTGSANIDSPSSSINYEVTAVLYSAALSAQLENDFALDLQDCVEFDPAEYSRRNVAFGSFGAAMALDAERGIKKARYKAMKLEPRDFMRHAFSCR